MLCKCSGKYIDIYFILKITLKSNLACSCTVIINVVLLLKVLEINLHTLYMFMGQWYFCFY